MPFRLTPMLQTNLVYKYFRTTHQECRLQDILLLFPRHIEDILIYVNNFDPTTCHHNFIWPSYMFHLDL